MEVMSARNATVTQNNSVYRKVNVSDFEKGQMSMWCHRGRWNHVVWDVKNQKKLTDAQRTIRVAASRGNALVIGKDNLVDYFVRM